MNFTYFDPSSVAIAVITYYPKWYQGKLRNIKDTDKVRGDLAIEFFSKATNLGYKVVVADGKSPKTFRKVLSKIRGLITIKRRSLKRSVARRQVIKRASQIPNVKVIISTEAEKTSLLDHIEKICRPILEKKADIVVPKRNMALFQKTYPLYMYESEIEGNKLYNKILRTNGILKAGEDFDLFFGPRVFANDLKVLRLFSKKYQLRFSKTTYLLNSHFDYEDYSTTQYFPLITALKKGFRVKSVDINFSYPEVQKENEERGERALFEEKRKYQRMIILSDLLYFLKLLKSG
ncbi:hypothetical protein A3I50_04165 [Candidatus Roizmanbacteria bacterium RIFCSPLOWO2_02_FULL_37_9]|nr:MAG: hypothetical protein A3I50_04165 [Candidatus Roizmanbacteria bacterium RIFCSPLOWO2_02_FULL_37_9]